MSPLLPLLAAAATAPLLGSVDEEVLLFDGRIECDVTNSESSSNHPDDVATREEHLELYFTTHDEDVDGPVAALAVLRNSDGSFAVGRATLDSPIRLPAKEGPQIGYALMLQIPESDADTAFLTSSAEDFARLDYSSVGFSMATDGGPTTSYHGSGSCGMTTAEGRQ